MDPDVRHFVGSGSQRSGLTLYLLSICAVLICAFIAWPFLPAITGALVLAVVTRRPYRWLASRFQSRTLAAAAALVLVILSIVTPALLVAYGVGQQVLASARELQGGYVQHAMSAFLDRHPDLAGALRSVAQSIDTTDALQKTAGVIAAKLGLIATRLLRGVIQIIIMLFILFFLYRDEHEAIRMTRSLLPLDKNEADFLLLRAQRAIQALVLGRFVVAAIQGFVAEITFSQLGISGAVLLGVATMLFALVPAVGAYVIWMPVVIFLAVSHLWVKSMILLVIGTLIISTLDNILYPVLVGPRLKLHIVPIFLFMLGGVWLFGVTGLVLGPILLNISNSLLLILRSRTQGEPLPTEGFS
jgi:predicted PurR-regulated permease PerM